MITIDFTKLKKYEKPILTAFPKDRTGLNKKANYFYIDFDNKVVKASNGTSHIEIDFSYNKDENDQIKNFYVDLHKLFFVIGEGDINLKFKGDNNTPVFFDDSGEYAIDHISEDNKAYVLPINLREKESVDASITIGEEEKATIGEAFNFFSPSLEEFNSLVLSSNRTSCITRVHMYINDSNFQIEDREIGIHKNVAKILLMFKEDITLMSIEKEKDSIVIMNEDLLLVVEEKVKFQQPPMEAIEGLYPKEDFIKVDKKAMLDTLLFFDPFYTTDSRPIKFEVKENILECSVTSTVDSVVKEVPILESSEGIVGTIVKYNSSTLKDMIKLVDSEQLFFYFNDEKMGIKVSNGESNKKMILIRYKKDS